MAELKSLLEQYANRIKHRVQDDALMDKSLKEGEDHARKDVENLKKEMEDSEYFQQSGRIPIKLEDLHFFLKMAYASGYVSAVKQQENSEEDREQ